MTDIEIIRSRLTKAELLAQLAEECAEMGKAALKLRRAIDGLNPTPVSAEEATRNLIEEHADVCACFEALEWSDKKERNRIKEEKLTRWANRIEQEPAVNAPGWVQFKECKPRKNALYLFSKSLRHMDWTWTATDVAWWKDGRVVNLKDIDITEYVTAWMPLPKPFRGGGGS